MKQIEFNQIKQVPDHRLIDRKTPPDRIISNDKLQIKSILKTSINIQTMVAYHYFYKAEFNIDETTNYAPFDDGNTDQGLQLIASVFDRVFIKKNAEGIPVLVQVSDTNKRAYEAFAELAVLGDLDDCIKHFYTGRHFKNDLCSEAFFKIEQKDISGGKNSFFDALLKDSPTSAFIDVSGFEIAEIEDDPYVQQLAARVKELYLWVYEGPQPGLYRKNLKWYL